MRFAFKTSPQYTTWADMLAVWQAADDIELGSITERFDRFEEACQVLISLLTRETTDFDGRFYHLEGARNEPKGPQRPHPPICIGGNGEKRTLGITARYAQHWNFVT